MSPLRAIDCYLNYRGERGRSGSLFRDHYGLKWLTFILAFTEGTLRLVLQIGRIHAVRFAEDSDTLYTYNLFPFREGDVFFLVRASGVRHGCLE